MKTRTDKIIFIIGLITILLALSFVWFAPDGMLNQNPEMYGIIK